MNWVKERSKCTASVRFEMLAEQVKSDVDAMEALQTTNVKWAFNRQNQKIVVARSIDGFPDAQVVFTLSKEAITAEYVEDNDHRTTLFKATPHFLDSGTCKLKINGTAVETWQVSHQALDRLFFRVG